MRDSNSVVLMLMKKKKIHETTSFALVLEFNPDLTQVNSITLKETVCGSSRVPFKDVKIIKSNSQDANAIQLCKPRQLPLLTVVELSEHTLSHISTFTSSSGIHFTFSQSQASIFPRI